MDTKDLHRRRFKVQLCESMNINDMLEAPGNSGHLSFMKQ